MTENLIVFWRPSTDSFMTCVLVTKGWDDVAKNMEIEPHYFRLFGPGLGWEVYRVHRRPLESTIQ